MAGTPWFCRVCGADAPDYIPSRSRTNRSNTLGRPHAVIAMPCGHEQVLTGSDYFGLGCRTKEEQRAYLIATSPAPTGTAGYLAALSNPHDRRHDRRKKAHDA